MMHLHEHFYRKVGGNCRRKDKSTTVASHESYSVVKIGVRITGYCTYLQTPISNYANANARKVPITGIRGLNRIKWIKVG